MQLYLEGIDFWHIFVAIRFGRQVVAVDSLNNIIYIELAVREDGEFFYAGNEVYISIYIGKFYLFGINFFIIIAKNFRFCKINRLINRLICIVTSFYINLKYGK